MKQIFSQNKTLQIISLNIALCFFILLVRIFHTGTLHYFFLNWNLFLAFVPYVLSMMFINKKNKLVLKMYNMLLFAGWLLFFPNSFYIITDFIHLRESTTAPRWFDLALIFSYAWTGLLLGFVSLYNVQQFMNNFFHQRASQIIIACIIFLASFGVYLGRYLRWNSWDIITQAYDLLVSIVSIVWNPFSYPGAWGATFFTGLILNGIYFSFNFLVHHKCKQKTISKCTI